MCHFNHVTIIQLNERWSPNNFTLISTHPVHLTIHVFAYGSKLTPQTSTGETLRNPRMLLIKLRLWNCKKKKLNLHTHLCGYSRLIYDFSLFCLFHKLLITYSMSLCALYSLLVEDAGLSPGPGVPFHHLSDLFGHFWGNSFTSGHQAADNVTLSEDDFAATQ